MKKRKVQQKYEIPISPFKSYSWENRQTKNFFDTDKNKINKNLCIIRNNSEIIYSKVFYIIRCKLFASCLRAMTNEIAAIRNFAFCRRFVFQQLSWYLHRGLRWSSMVSPCFAPFKLRGMSIYAITGLITSSTRLTYKSIYINLFKNSSWENVE